MAAQMVAAQKTTISQTGAAGSEFIANYAKYDC